MGACFFCVFLRLLFVDRNGDVVTLHPKLSVLFCVLFGGEEFAEVKKVLYLCGVLTKEKHY